MSNQVARRFDLVIGLLGVGIGASLAVSAFGQVRTERGPGSEALLLVVGLILVVINVVLLYAKRYNPGLLYKQVPPPDPARLAELDARLRRRDAVESALHRGNRIQAIKIYRDDTGAALGEAKAAVEALEEQLQRPATG